MPDIKLRDGSGVENTYEGVDTITLPLADGSGNWTFGLTDEELTFNNASNMFSNSNKTMFDLMYKYKDRIKFTPKSYNYIIGIGGKNFIDINDSGGNYDFSDLILDADGINSIALSMYDAKGVIKLPTILKNNLYISHGWGISNGFNKITEQELLNYLNHFDKCGSFTDGEISGANANMVNCYNMWNSSSANPIEDTTAIMTKWNAILNNPDSKLYSSPTLRCTYGYTSWIKKFLLPVPSLVTYAQTSNIFDSNVQYMTGCDSFKFCTDENNEPYKVNWKSQNLKLNANSGLGCVYGYYDTPQWNNINQAWRQNGVNLFTSDNMTIEDAQARYNEVKNLPYWFSATSKRVTYDSKSIYIAKLFSRFNHDSAVELINSLPDTSEYLAIAGGTNTLTLPSYCGACTDAGGTNDLTAAEIQVATDKGWTVTFVD